MWFVPLRNSLFRVIEEKMNTSRQAIIRPIGDNIREFQR